MATYYHVAPSTYTDGEDLLSWSAYVERYGEDPGEWKWDDEGLDTTIVCLFRESQRDDALEFAAMWVDGPAKLLTIEIPEDALPELTMGVNEEGYDYVLRLIPAEFIARVEAIA